jgi:aspartyl-tRNA synthetase
MHSYRTHKCNELRKTNVGETARLSGWIHRIRDHGGVLFIDLRDTYGLTQCVIEQGSPLLAQVAHWRNESVITVTGKVKARTPETTNTKMPTGEIEVEIAEAALQSPAAVVPFQIAEDDGAGEDIRLRYRYLDLRREKMQRNIRLRNSVIASIRKRMWDSGFQEFQTPNLTASSPEGARDYLVPSRLHPGKFYALPQSPQQFKQLLMVAGFDRYFQIAPCFRDEDSRADRLPEHYQLDVEMSFVTEDEVHSTMTPVIKGLFEEFADWTGTKHKVEWLPKITYSESMLKYGSDKPDLRNPIVMFDASNIFEQTDFAIFKKIVQSNGQVRAIPVKGAGKQPRSWFDKLGSWAMQELGMPAPPAYILPKEMRDGKIVVALRGPLAKFLDGREDLINQLYDNPCFKDVTIDDAIFFVAGNDIGKLNNQAGQLRTKIGQDLDLLEKNVYKFCWVVDFPMYEFDEKAQKVEFSHNPFSMPQGGLETLEKVDPLKIYAHQYDLVCNGYELSSGAIRNHRPDIMEKAFAIAGYSKEVLEHKFAGMLNAFRFGAPPHGGCGIGVDRIVMLLSHEPNLREVNAFVMNGQYEDPMMNAPSAPTPEQLKDLHIRLDLPKPQQKQLKTGSA